MREQARMRQSSSRSDWESRRLDALKVANRTREQLEVIKTHYATKMGELMERQAEAQRKVWPIAQ
jgi:hypothetical protein